MHPQQDAASVGRSCFQNTSVKGRESCRVVAAQLRAGKRLQFDTFFRDVGVLNENQLTRVGTDVSCVDQAL